MTIPGRRDIAFGLLILAFCAYAGIYIYRTSFVFDGERYFTLFDDAMVSMRYAKNLASGYGLVWNPGGERVEGYTNLLWVVYMSIFHLLPIAQSKISAFIQVSGALFLMINLFFVRKIATSISNGSAFVSLGAVLLTAFYLPLNTWSLQGMEVSILTLIVSISLWKALQCIESQKVSVLLYALLGVSTLIRIDMAVPFLAILTFLIAVDKTNRKQHLLLGLSSLILFIGLQTAFRVYYYGDILPNTYYLKVTGFPTLLRIFAGLSMFSKFVWYMNWIFFLLPFAMLLHRRNAQLLLLAWAILGQVLYSVYVGGDAWEAWGGSNRYLSIVMPVFFVLFCHSLVTARVYLADKAGGQSALARNPAWYAIIVLLISLLNFNAISGASALTEWLQLTPALHVSENQQMVKSGLLLSKITSPRASIAVVWAGAIPYFANRPAVDILGKSDRVIAYQDMRMISGRAGIGNYFYPGHLKWDYGYSIGKLKPDIVAQLWVEEEAIPYLKADYTKVELEGFTFYLRNGSGEIFWDKVGSDRSVLDGEGCR